MNNNAILLKDGYKLGHPQQYPENTQFVYSNLTARTSRVEGIDSTVFFGLQYFMQKYLVEYFNDNFFEVPLVKAVKNYHDFMISYLGSCPDTSVDQVRDLHNLGYLPISIKALPEGTITPIRTPMLTIVNTDSRFGWVTNSLETILSTTMWLPITSATTARKFRKTLDQWCKETGGDLGFVPFQGHDFSMRGMAGLEAAQMSGAAHLTSFLGTDTVPAIPWLEEYYDADGMIGCSVPATEHAVMCLHGDDSELETFRDLIVNRYPTGIISIVSDTWDFWRVVTEFLPKLKDEIMARDGKVVIRPDSGDPVKIICGDPDAPDHSLERKGLIQCLYDTFGGGKLSSANYVELDSHIGAIYGDAITLDRVNEISSKLMYKGFASTNVVFGIGSYTYQHVTRDTFGMAVKATWAQVAGESREIYKDPKTDDGTKKSLKGLIRVDENLMAHDQQTLEQEGEGLLKEVFSNGRILVRTNLEEIRARLAK